MATATLTIVHFCAAAFVRTLRHLASLLRARRQRLCVCYVYLAAARA
jgi:hypothetical protein